MRWLFVFLLNGLIVFLVSWFTPGVSISGYGTALLIVVLLGFFNIFLKPVLILLTLPITLLTLGLFLLVINGAIVLLVDALLPGFYVENLLWAIIFTLILTLVNYLATER